MVKASSEPLDAALSALGERRLADYVAAVRRISDFGEREALWAEIGKQHGKAVDLVNLLLIWPAEDRRSAFRYLAPAIAHAPSLTAAQILELLQLTAIVPQADCYYLHKALVEVFRGDNEVAKEVGDALRSDNSSVSDRRWELWAGAFSQASTPAAAKFASQLPVGTADERLAFALLLERLQTGDPSVARLQPRHEEIVSALIQEAPIEGTDFSVHWAALCRLADFSGLAMRAIMEAAHRGERPALMALSNWLHGRPSDVLGVTRTPLQEVIDLLLEKSIADEELRTRVADGAIGSLLHNGNLRALVLPCLEKLGTVAAPVAEVFKESFGALNEFPGAAERLLTAWLVSPNGSFAAIKSLLHRFSGPRGTVGLDASTFMAATPERQEAALKRLLVLTMDGTALCSFVALLAESPDFQPVGLGFARRLLHDVFVEYPGATEDFLQERMKNLDPKASYAPVYQAVHQSAERWKQVLEELPRLKELKPSDTEWLAIRALKVRFNRDVNRRAEEQSILGALFGAKIHIAQGRKSTSLFGPGAMQVIKFGEYSHSVEFPSSYVSDPLGAEIRRRKILVASR
jgi:hypothetical protein